MRRVPEWLRSKGSVDLSFRKREGRNTVYRSYQSGCLRARTVREAGQADRPCMILINGAGGVADGDRLDQRVVWEEGADGTITTQAAEKVYRALAGYSAISTRLDVARGAHAEWLPQETILFDGCHLRREARIVLAEDVTFIGVEALVLGRTAMGEIVRSGTISDRMRIWRNGRLVYADALSLDGDIAALMRRIAIGNGGAAMAVLIHAAPEAARMLQPVRDALDLAEGRAAASSWNGLLAVRLLAPCGETLRHDIALALNVLRGGRALPRVWSC